MFTLILKNGKRIASEKADDLSTFWDKTVAERDGKERKGKKVKKNS